MTAGAPRVSLGRSGTSRSALRPWSLWLVVRSLALLGIFGAALFVAPRVATSATFTVNDTGDAVDAIHGDGSCSTAAGVCTLRAAIEEANALAGTDAITFNIPGIGPHSIMPGGELPPITEPVVIDGYTQPGASPNTNPLGSPANAVIMIELDGTNAGGGNRGLRITGGGTTISGLAINHFSIYGINIGSFAGGGGGSANVIQGNYIGTDPTGTLDLGNSSANIFIIGSPDNIIGGTSAADRNVISGSGSATSNPPSGVGIYIIGSASTGNLVQGNYIGTNASGTGGLANGTHGVRISGAAGNLVGGVADQAGNVISGNGIDGIRIEGNVAIDNVVQGNLIGTNAMGSATLGNSGNGVTLVSAGLIGNSTVGGVESAARNIISGNGDAGVAIGIAGGGRGSVVQGNYIGTDVTGSIALGNTHEGVRITGSRTNTIGGTSTGAGNLISGNGGHGVFIAAPTSGSTGVIDNLVQGNVIGADAAGTANLGNGGDGVRIRNAQNNTVGGLVAAARNLISGNGGVGVYIDALAASPQNLATGNLVQGNYIGTDVSGASALGNTAGGVRLDSLAANNTIGGSSPGARNIISGNGGVGVDVRGNDPAEVLPGNRVQGNYIGVDASGSIALGNARGVSIAASNNTIGGTASGAGNVISANAGVGILIESFAASALIEGNYIGTDFTGGGALGNASDGVRIEVAVLASPARTIGGTPIGAGNIIAHNSGGGVVLEADLSGALDASGSRIVRNSIHSNAGLGIDLDADGVTPNDLGDSDTGANGLQNFPVITSAVSSSVTAIDGALHSTPSTSFSLDFYSSPAADPSGFGEGAVYLGSATVVTDALGDVTFSEAMAATATGHVVTATATDPGGSTSEFSGVVVADGPLVILVSERVEVADDVGVGGTLVVLVSERIEVTDDVVVGGPLVILVVEQIAVADEVMGAGPLVILVSEAVVVADGVTVAVPLVILVSEQVEVADDVAVTVPLVILIVERIGVADDVVMLADIDGDGIAAAIDGFYVAGTFESEATLFSDRFTDQQLGGTTFGAVTDRQSQVFTIEDTVSPLDGVRIQTGSDAVALTTCAAPYELTFAPNTTANFACGSITIVVDSGAVTIPLFRSVLTIPAGATVTIDGDPDGTSEIMNSSLSDISVSLFVDGAALSIAPGQTLTVYNAQGAMNAVLAAIDERLITETDPSVLVALQLARNDLDGNHGGEPNNGALDELEAGDLVAALVKISNTIEHLDDAEAAGGADASELEMLLTLAAQLVAQGAFDDAAAAVGPSPSKGQQKQLDKIAGKIADGMVQRSLMEYAGAVDEFARAVRWAVGLLP